MKKIIEKAKRFHIDQDGCWIWNGSIDSTGYAILNIDGQRKYVHRLMYQLYVGPINKWLEIDHLCRKRSCINPFHLEAVTSRENSMRGNHPLFTLHRKRKCKKGHDLNIEENRIYRKDGRYRCKICNKEYQRNYREKMINNKKAYKEGQKAYKEKISPESNPYDKNDQKFYIWLDGYVGNDFGLKN